MTHHLLWRACGCVFVWISANVTLVDSQCLWGEALWPVLSGCCFVWTAAGGSRPWLFAACELEPSRLINRLPGVLNNLVQVAAFTFSFIRKRMVYWATRHPWQGVNRNKKKIALACFYSIIFVNKRFFCQKSNVLSFFFMQKLFCSHASCNRSCFYLTNTTTSQVKHLHCYEAVSIQPSQLLQKCKHLLIQ